LQEECIHLVGVLVGGFEGVLVSLAMFDIEFSGIDAAGRIFTLAYVLVRAIAERGMYEFLRPWVFIS